MTITALLAVMVSLHVSQLCITTNSVALPNKGFLQKRLLLTVDFKPVVDPPDFAVHDEGAAWGGHTAGRSPRCYSWRITV
jgi:hypothetical protein